MENVVHPALRTPDILEQIFAHLDTSSLAAAEETCLVWKDVVLRAGLWKKLALSLASKSEQDKVTLEQKGLRKTFEEGSLREESKHFRELCVKFVNYKVNWRTIVPTETLLCCTPSQVNKTFGFSWSPNWFWANQDGWICSFKVQGELLLVGVIETLQVWHLSSSACVAILETPRDDLVPGVDFALNCLDLLDDTAVSGSNEGIIRIWEISSEKFLRRLDCSEFGAVNALRLTKELMLSGHDDGQLMVWKMTAAKEQIFRLYLLFDHPDILWCLDLDREHLVTCSEDQTICVYQSNNLLEAKPPLQHRLTGHKDAVTCVSLKGSTLVSGSRDCTVRVWLLSPGDPSLVRELAGHSELVHYVAIDQDRIYSSDQSGQLFVWAREEEEKVFFSNERDNQIIPRRRDMGLIRKLDFGDRGAIDCIQVHGSQVFTSFDDFGSVVISDFW